jgi:Ring hydroxylating alpha subunit (catalytic domain)
LVGIDPGKRLRRRSAR